MLNALGWITAMTVAATYVAYEHDSKWANVFSWANVIGALILIPINLVFGVGFGAFLNFVFGIGAAHGLWKRHRGKNVLRSGDKCIWKSKDYDWEVEFIGIEGEYGDVTYAKVKTAGNNPSCVPYDELVKA